MWPARRPLPLYALFPLLFAAVLLAHYTLLRLPYYWDEGGYYIPAALDFFRTGTLIPQSTITNAHPPLPSLLLAAEWHLTGFHILATRSFVCLVAATSLLAVYRLSRALIGQRAAAAVTLLTACYPIWYVQSTLAHADIFAAAFTLWALALYLEPATSPQPNAARAALIAVLFALSALSKETAIVTPFALALYHLYLLIRHSDQRRKNLRWLATLATTVLPLVAWYAYHRHRTGFIFGNPEFLRYNATANLDAHRAILSLYHRALHLLTHMNMWAATLLTAACFLIPRRLQRSIPTTVHTPIAIILIANWIAFSVLGGALLTRYLLPMYPLILLLFIAQWRERTGFWPYLTALTAAAFLAALHFNPPYAFAPEDNLTYRDMIVLHEQAVAIIEHKFPEATVLTAWPANAELSRPDLGYTHTAIKVVTLQNFAFAELLNASQSPGDYDTALLFSTKYEPPAGRTNFSRHSQNTDARYFDFHHDLLPTEAARVLHGDILWQSYRNGEWAAILRFPRSYEAHLAQNPQLKARN